MNNLPFETWDYEAQTKMKHEVLGDYIDKWMKIVGKYNKLNYVDGFGGVGAYKDKSGKLYYGSPILAAQSAQHITNKLSRNVNIIVIDEKKTNLDNIQKIFDSLKLEINPILINADFDKTINEILDSVKNIAPTFIFIDPFGFKLKIATIKRIMEIPKSEILLNFMFTRINQFLAAPKLKNMLNELFGCNEWEQLKVLKGNERERGIIELYRKQLKQFANFVYYFRLEFPAREKTYYYLFHLTNYFRGCAIMKSSFAKFNLGRVEYRGNRGNQLDLFETSSIKINQVGEYLLSIYRGKTKSFQNVIEDLIDETEFLESHLRSALKQLEKEKQISINRIPAFTSTGKTRTGIDDHDMIVFKAS